jgi:Ca-activated chloride channel family protein
MSKKVFTPRLSLLSCLAVIAVFLAATPTLPQNADPQAQRPRKVFPVKEQDPDEVVKVDTELVSVDVTVTDTDGRPVRNLRKESFKLYSDGVEQPLAFFQMERRAGEPRPLAIVFTLDISGSMTPEEIERLRSAMQAFSLQIANHSALYAVMTFGMNVKTLQKFTNDPEKLDRTFDRIAREPNGMSTHTYDAVDDAVRMLVRHAPRTQQRRLMKRAVIVVTDGFPVGDTVSAPTVIERANAADVSVYVVTLPSYSRMMAASSQAPLPTPLDVSGLAELTGGRSYYVNEEDYGPLFKSLAEEVNSAYVLAFYPPEEKRRDGQMHTIKVEGPGGLMLRQSRQSYHATK